MALGLLTLSIHLPGCSSLKDKRSRLKPLLARLHREFNVSAAEIARNDAWKEAVIACAYLSSDQAQTQRALQQVVHWTETNWPDIEVENDVIEILG